MLLVHRNIPGMLLLYEWVPHPCKQTYLGMLRIIPGMIYTTDLVDREVASPQNSKTYISLSPKLYTAVLTGNNKGRRISTYVWYDIWIWYGHIATDFGLAVLGYLVCQCKCTQLSESAAQFLSCCWMAWAWDKKFNCRLIVISARHEGRDSIPDGPRPNKNKNSLTGVPSWAHNINMKRNSTS